MSEEIDACGLSDVWNEVLPVLGALWQRELDDKLENYLEAGHIFRVSRESMDWWPNAYGGFYDSERRYNIPLIKAFGYIPTPILCMEFKKDEDVQIELFFTIKAVFTDNLECITNSEEDEQKVKGGSGAAH
jgi:hypothetical protein